MVQKWILKIHFKHFILSCNILRANVWIIQNPFKRYLKPIFLTHESTTTLGPSGCGSNGNEGATPHLPKLQNWNFISGFSLIFYPEHKYTEVNVSHKPILLKTRDKVLFNLILFHGFFSSQLLLKFFKFSSSLYEIELKKSCIGCLIYMGPMWLLITLIIIIWCSFFVSDLKIA